MPELAPNAPTDGKGKPRKKKELPCKPSLHKAQCKTLGRAAQFWLYSELADRGTIFTTEIAPARWLFPSGA